MTAHNEAKKDEISKNVLMAGDPERVKKIAEKYLKNPKLVNKIRGMYAYTGTYKGKTVTVMAHGMGMPSAGIYVYELYKYYGVEKIIRLGTCGTDNSNIHLLDILLASSSYTVSNYALTFNNEDIHFIDSSQSLNDKVIYNAKQKNIQIEVGNILTSDCFDWYIQTPGEFNKKIPNNLNILGVEMESFAIFYIAKVLKKRATSLLVVVDSHYDKKEISKEEINRKIEEMTIIALDSIV